MANGANPNCSVCSPGLLFTTNIANPEESCIPGVRYYSVFPYFMTNLHEYSYNRMTR
jgi:hypothetical protein